MRRWQVLRSHAKPYLDPLDGEVEKLILQAPHHADAQALQLKVHV